MNDDYDTLFKTLSTNLEAFVHEVQSKKSTLMTTDKWTVKEVLCHIVFWHENYAANYAALAKSEPPPLLIGPGYKLNIDGVAALRKFSISELIHKLRAANKTLYINAVQKKVPQMTYKKNGRIFKTAEFLYMVARHIKTHTNQVKKS